MNDLDGLYGDQIMEHYRTPCNRGVLEHPDASYEDQNPLCGDTIRIDLAYDPPLSPLSKEVPLEQRRIAAIRFSGSGCAISQAAASLLTELVRGRTVAEARALTKDELLAEVGIPLSPTRLKCALLAHKVCQAALYGLEPPRDTLGVRDARDTRDTRDAPRVPRPGSTSTSTISARGRS